jgi:hypothetical protein
MSEAGRGDKNHLFGKSPSYETKKRISEKMKGRIISEETKKQ